jgi:hypothetical protein
MVTTNDDDRIENKNIFISDQIETLIENFNQKKLTPKSVKNKLIFHAKSSGFINNLYRKPAWNILINSASNDYSTGKFLSD